MMACVRQCYSSIKGKVRSISHIFYLPGASKCFLVEFITEQCELKLIVVLLRGLDQTFKRFQTQLVINKDFDFLNLYWYEFKFGNKQRNIWAFRTTAKSKACPLTGPELRAVGGSFLPDPCLKSYEGIVTDDAFRHSSIYQVDRRNFLILTPISGVTNIRLLHRGDRVVVIMGHIGTLNKSNIKLVFVCSRSFVWVADRCEGQSMHFSESVEQLNANAVVKASLFFNLNVNQIWMLHQVINHVLRQRFPLYHFNRHFSHKSLAMKTCHALGLGQLIQTDAQLAEGSQGVKSLVETFVDEPHACISLNRDSSLIESIEPPSQLSFTISTLVDALKTALEDKLQSCIDEDFSEVLPKEPRLVWRCVHRSQLPLPSSHFFLGILTINQLNGQMEVSDSSGSVAICIKVKGESDDSAFSSGRLVRINDFTGVIEWAVNMSGVIWRKMYLLVKASDVIVFEDNDTGSKNPGLLDDKKPLQKWRVIHSSGPIHVFPTCDDKISLLCVVRNIHSPLDTYSPTNNYLLRIPASQFRQLPTMSVIHADFSQPIIQQHCPVVSNQSQLVAGCRLLNAKVLCPLEFEPFWVQASTPASSAFRLDQIDDIPYSKMVDLVAVIVERWFEPNEFCSPASVMDKELPSDCTNYSLHFKLRDTAQSIGRVSMYLKNWFSLGYPLGMMSNSLVKFHNVVKVKSKKGNDYFKSTLFTHYQLIDENVSETADYEEHLVTLDSLLKVSVQAVCCGCKKELLHNRCQFVGCQMPMERMKPTFVVRCVAMVSTTSVCSRKILLHVNDLCQAQCLLRMNDAEWQWLLQAAADLGEVLYLQCKRGHGAASMSGVDADDASRMMEAYCWLLPQVWCVQYHTRWRHMDDQQQHKKLAFTLTALRS